MAPAGQGSHLPGMKQVLQAGAAYFAAVFALGFVLGILRILVLTPLLRPAGAVAAELAVLLPLAWLLCRRIAGRWSVPARPGPRLGMGAVAFALNTEATSPLNGGCLFRLESRLS